MDKYKVKSDYTLLRKKLQNVEDGNVYENNLMTISSMDGLFDDGQVLYADSNFRFSVNSDKNIKKKHARSNWLRTPNGSGYEWTYEDVKDSTISEESEVRIKPDYSRLNDFAYFGSAKKLIQASVNDVILNFPAELYFTKKPMKVNNNRVVEDYKIDGKTAYVISNDFQINADIPYINDDEVENPLRFLCNRITDYDFISGGTVVDCSGLTIDIKQKTNWTCLDDENGGIFASATVTVHKDVPESIDIYTYRKNGIKTLLYTANTLSGCSIRPYNAVVDNFYNTIDVFVSVLLDRSTNPVYKAVFETPRETDKGFFYEMKSYIWPSINEWNPDITSQAYTSYISSLISLAEFYDEYYSDILWRMDTHESIKNLDWTFYRNNGDTIEDLSNIDTSRIEPVIQLYGRQFDGLKRYIDNIKHSNQITYDQKSNMPDYCLTDVAGLSGWDVLVIKPKALATVVTEPLYSASTKGFSEVDMNTHFMRNLKLNSKALMAMKGTRKGVEAILGLLGLKKDEYEINEKIGIACGMTEHCEINGCTTVNTSLYPTYESVKLINEKKNTFIFDDYETEQANELQGLAVKQYGDYVIPWFNADDEHDGDWYFQCKGGWGKRKDKHIDLPELTDITSLKSTSDFSIYDETEPYLKFATNITEMLEFLPGEVNNGDVCYVSDVNDITKYKEYQDIQKEIEASGISHYFILINTDNSALLGNNGWKYIPTTDIRLGADNGKKVIYLESLVDKTTGNNPHIGNGKYDDGKEYIDYLNEIFKDAIETSGLSLFTKTDIDNIKKYYKFNIVSDITDNVKCNYFLNESGNSFTVVGTTSGLTDEEVSLSDVNINCINPESGDTRLLPSANSIINLKNMEIIFKYPIDFSGVTQEKELKTQWKEYIDNIVMEYVKQMMPSTTILKYEMVDEKIYKNAIPINDTNAFLKSPKFADGVIYTNADLLDGPDTSNTNKIIR